MTPKRIGIIGVGRVGSALASGWRRAGHDVKAVGNDRTAVRQTAEWGTVVILAVPFGALDDVVEVIGPAVDEKPVVDVTNALDRDSNLAVGFTSSGAEDLQRKLPRAHVVKAFNTVFAQHMDTGRLGEERASAFIAGDDAAARATVADLARDIGFDPIDSGPLRNARLLEPTGYLMIQFGYVLGMGTQIGLKLLHR